MCEICHEVYQFRYSIAPPCCIIPNASSPGIQALVLISPAGLADIPPLDSHIPSSNLSAPIRLLDAMWSSNFTPQQIVRLLGPSGPGRVKEIVKRRFGAERWADADATLIADYLYHISAAPASGEYAMNSLLKPIVSKAGGDITTTAVYAREPVTPAVFVKAFSLPASPATRTKIPPVLILYGDHDWLRFPGVSQYVSDLRAAGVDAEGKIVPSAGHHLYLDNTEAFHSTIQSWLGKINYDR
jgi:pimeloyl-ACP methyl ester carboxylesterase